MHRRQCCGLAAKAAALKGLLRGPGLACLMEAHSGISARIVQEAGFKGIWASGLSISASLGVRDNNEASWTQMCDVFEFMSDATDIPILVDADTGYGNFNNARRLVKKLEKIGIAGACIEDKLFPKTNSLLEGHAQPLADVVEFSGKIKAMKDTQCDENFCVIARVESLIAGWPMEEALKRATAYADAGADAVLIHSKRRDATHIEEFMTHWGKLGSKTPIVIVPTNYWHAISMKRLKELDVRVVIWANHNLRAAVKSMQDVTKKIFQQQSLEGIDDSAVSVKEVFRLQQQGEYVEAEGKYLPKQHAPPN